MAESKEGDSFFRKVVRFVANPATDWSEIGVRPDEGQELERTELKAMIERKRRNDFVRKREFDVLRKLRREGLSPEQLAALGGSSKVDDSEVRMSEGARSDTGVKAKIDEIEQQMVGNEGIRPSERQRYTASAPTEPLAFQSAPPATPPAPAYPRTVAQVHPPVAHRPAASENLFVPGAAASNLPVLNLDPPSAPAASSAGSTGAGIAPLRQTATGSRPAPTRAPASPVAAPGQVAPARATASSAPARTPPAVPVLDLSLEFDGSPLAMEVSEVMHDPELDEAVIAFANADFALCEQAITQMARPGAVREFHAETWLVLFDLYRATGMQAKFEALAMDYANTFGASAPQWFSLPKLVAETAALEERPKSGRIIGDVGWLSPAVLDIDAVAHLRSTTLQLPLPWVLDWSALQRVEPEAAAQLTTLFRQWAPQRLELRWLAAEQLTNALAEAAPTGVRDADPAFWMARLEALRLSNRPDQFDETAIDYCVTYEVSPPSWEPAQCVVRAGGTTNSTTTPPMSIVSEVQTNFQESGLHDEHSGIQQVASVELSGQLSGDIGATLKKIDAKLGAAPLVNVSCARLIRVDFIAAGDLLNWVLAKRSENRSVTFIDAHRLVALFFGAMGINEHARVQVPRG